MWCRTSSILSTLILNVMDYGNDVLRKNICKHALRVRFNLIN